MARRIGAINTIRVENGRWIGGNTDASGFLEPLQERVALAGLRASVLGAGGAARAVVDRAGVERLRGVTVHARNRQQAEDVAMMVSGRVGAWPPEPGSWDLLINCTPIGMYPARRRDADPGRATHRPLRLRPGLQPAGDAAAARGGGQAGCQTIGGLEMLVAQAQEQFQWWTGRSPSPASCGRPR